ncbi:mitochondrial thiamine pyrophosphate carrier-like [Ischnura elegans]|uniref:mitochondrial thiamine pyrophosphate carrier-like n=1 Tax=Ischnura elegans TaxID=197161 RepID=UPI001ED8A4AE|nr:mitochondrial thiamine pyrophosphate carrier-like [Ischnura elegans]XP_046398968.1 mitochondrial thiamine pyrophosphate carrier-like [Ischnura elegans]XP_046398969.1 mitochondrial thiamine pyrophosphate carrier-like [Ischnura elegans]
MIGYDPSSERKLKNSHHAIAGAVSGFFTRGICQPFDVLKIRFQLQWEPLSKQSSTPGLYTGVIQATKRIYRDEGVKALWKGHVPAQYLSVVYGSAQFYSFQLLTLLWHHWVSPMSRGTWANEHSPVTHFSCGCMSGAIATVVSFPIDIVRTRLVAQGEPKLYRGMTHAITTMYTTEGVGSFFRGLTPAVIQTAPLIGAQFGFYNFFIELWGRCQFGLSKEGEKPMWFPVVGTLGSGALAGLASKTLVYPLDLIKKRLQMKGFEESRKSFGKVVVYRGLWHCLTSTVREEGFWGLYKGFSPSMLKAACTSAFHFAFYEFALYLLVISSS